MGKFPISAKETFVSSISPLTPYDMPAQLGELVLPILFNIHEMSSRFGLENYAEGGITLRKLKLLGQTRIHLAATVLTHDEILLFVGDSNRDAWHVVLKSGMLTWDKSLKPNDLFQAMHKTDEMMTQLGNRETSGRRRDVMTDAEARLPLDLYFDEPGKKYALNPKHDSQTLRNRFDHPEELMVLEYPALRILCRRSDAVVILRENMAPAGSKPAVPSQRHSSSRGIEVLRRLFPPRKP